MVDDPPPAYERALRAFGLLTQEELHDLLSMSKTTLTFTVTYRAVSSLVVDDGRGTALLGVAVMAIIFVITALKAELPLFIPNKALLVRVDRFLGLCNDVAVQFVSNLIAVVLASTFAEAKSAWWVITFAIFGLALIGHATTPGG